MAEPRQDGRWSEQRVEQTMGMLLRIGVLLSALVVLCGGLAYLIHHGGELADYRHFHGRPWQLSQMLDSAHGYIELGLLLLVATPVLRVAFAVFAFVKQRDHFYTGVALLVLLVLGYALLIAD